MADPVPDPGSARRQGGDVAGIETGQLGFDALHQAIVGQVMAISLGSDGEAVGNIHPGAVEGLVHFTQGGILAAHQGDVVNVDFGKGLDIAHGVFCFASHVITSGAWRPVCRWMPATCSAIAARGARVCWVSSCSRAGSAW